MAFTFSQIQGLNTDKEVHELVQQREALLSDIVPRAVHQRKEELTIAVLKHFILYMLVAVYSQCYIFT